MEAKRSLIGTDEEYDKLSNFYDEFKYKNASVDGKFEIEIGTVGGSTIFSLVEKNIMQLVCEQITYDLVNKTVSLKLCEYNAPDFYTLIQKLVRVFEEFNLIYVPKDNDGKIQGWSMLFEKGTIISHTSTNSLVDSCSSIGHELNFVFNNIIYTFY